MSGAPAEGVCLKLYLDEEQILVKISKVSQLRPMY